MFNEKKSRKLFVRKAAFCLFMSLISVTPAISSEETALDVGLLLRIAGKVEYTDGSAGKVFKKAVPFMKIRENDRLKVAKGAEAGILFQTNGRKETWKGPVELEITLIGSRPSQKATAPVSPKIGNIDILVVDKVFSTSPLIAQAVGSRSGVGVVRGEKSGSDIKRELKTQMAVYAELKQNRDSEEEILPELFLLATYAEYGKKEEMKRLVHERP